MGNSVMVRAEPTSAARRTLALITGTALAAFALVAFAGQRAATPAAAALPQLSLFGPGALGQLRARDPGVKAVASKSLLETARRALVSAPLADEPFTAIAAVSFSPTSVGSISDGALLREAIRRNPRAREARLLLMRHALGNGALGEAINQLAVLGQLNSAAVGQLMAALGVAVRTSAQVDEAIAALRPHPELYKSFLLGFAVAEKPPELVVRLVRGVPAAVLADPDNRRVAIGQMIRSGAYAEARALWATGGSASKAAASATLVHSPDFSDIRALPPFNWELYENTSGAAERIAGGGLALAYYGRVPGSLAAQLMTLTPGNHRLELRYRSVSGSPGAIVVKLFCAREGTSLAEIPLTGAAGKPEVLRAVVTVPASGCRGQYLALAGRVQTSRDAQEISVAWLSIERGSGT